MKTRKKRTFSNIGRMMKVYRLEENLSQTQLSEKLGYKNAQFVSNVERGLCSIPANRVNRMSAALRVPRERIVDAMISDYKSYIHDVIDYPEIEKALH